MTVFVKAHCRVMRAFYSPGPSDIPSTSKPLDAIVNQHLNNKLPHTAYRNMRRQHPGKDDGKSLLEVGSLGMRIREGELSDKGSDCDE